MPQPLALSDESLAMLMRLSEPLPPDDRSKFLAEVAAYLSEFADVYDGYGGDYLGAVL